MADKITSIYEKACAKGILDPKTQSEEWFRNQISTENGMKSFYDHATANGMKFHPYPEFKERLMQPAQPSTTGIRDTYGTDTGYNPEVEDRVSNAFGGMQDPLYSGQYNYHQKVKEREDAMQREAEATLPLSPEDVQRQAEINKLQEERFRSNFERAENGGKYELYPTVNKAAIDELERQKPSYLTGTANTPKEVYERTMAAWTANTPEGQKAKAQADKDTDQILTNIKQQFDADVDGHVAQLQKQFEAEPGVKNLVAQLNKQFSDTEFKQLQDRVNRGELSVEDAQAQADAVWKEKYAPQIQEKANALWKEKYVPQVHQYADKLWEDNYKEMYSNEATIIRQSLMRQMSDANKDYLNQQLRKLGQAEVNRSTKALSEQIQPQVEKLEAARRKMLTGRGGNGTAYGAIGAQMAGNIDHSKDKELALLKQAQEFLNDAQKISEGAAKSGKGFWKDLAKGFGANITDVDTWDFGISQLIRSDNLKTIVEKYEKDKNNLSKEEKALMDAAVTYMASCAYNSDKLSRGYKAGQTTAESIPFMLQFLITPVEATKNKIAKGILGYGIEQFGGKAVQAAGKKFTTKAALKEAGTLLLGNAASAGVMTAGFGLPKITEGTISRMTGDIKPEFDENGHLMYGGRENMQGVVGAAWNSLVDTYVENLSEVILTSGDPIKALVRGSEWFSKSIGKSEVVRLLADLEKTPFGKVADRMQFRNYPEEVAEEYVGNIIKWGASTDIHSAKEAGLDADSQIDLWLGLAPTSLAFAGLGLASYGAQGGLERLQNAEAANRMRELIGEGEARKYFEDLLQANDSEDFSTASHDFVKSIVQSKNLSDDRKREILNEVYTTYQSQLAKEAEQVQQEEKAEEAQAQADRTAQMRATAQAQAQAEVQSIAHEDGNIYNVGIKGRDDVAGYVMSGQLNIEQDEDGNLKATGRDLVTIKMVDGSVRQLPADEVSILGAPENAQEHVQAITDHLLAKQANNELFQIGDKVYLKQGNQLVSPDSSTITNIDDDGVHVETIDEQGNPQEMVIPHEQAAETLAAAPGETEEGIVSYSFPDGSELRLRQVGDGVYQTIAPDETGELQIFTDEDLQDAGATPTNQQQEQPEQPAETPQTGTTEQAPAYPVDEFGNPAWSQIDQAQATNILYDLFQGNKGAAQAYADDALKEAEKVQRAAAKKQSHSLNIAQRLEEDAAFKAEKDAANAAVNYWQNIKLSLNQIKTAEEQAADEAQRQALMQARTERSKTEEGVAAGTTMAERFNAAPKIEGHAGTITLPDGRELAGHYILISPDGLTTSHNALDGYKRSEGYPVTSDGQSINDRDYTNDPEEQQKVESVAQNFNGNAIKNMPVISDEGLVYDGNGRMMAGQLAAINNTDAAYMKSLAANATQYGFSPEQVESIPHARVAFQLDERLPYSTQSLAIFNEQETQTQSNTGKAAGYARKLTPQAISEVLAAVDGFNTIDAFFSDKKAPFDLINQLINTGIIAQREKAEMLDGNKLSATGRERLSNILFGTVFDNETIRLMGDDAALKNSILRALPQILDNKSLGEYSLESDINDAIRLLYQVRNADVPFRSFVSQTVIAEDGQVHTAAEGYSPYQLLLAEEMSEGGVDAFRDVLTSYNDEAHNVQGGQVDIFSNLLTPAELKNLTLQRYGKEPNEQERQTTGREANNAPESAQPGNEQPAEEVTEPDKIVPERPNSKQLQGMSYNVAEAEDYIGRVARNILDENGYEDVEIVGTKVIGSRVNGNAREDSDLDAVIEFKGDAREDALFNLFADENIELDGIKVDINPITEGKSGTIEQFMRRSDEYLAEKAATQALYDALAQAEAETDTNPTEAQKKAENYKQGHVTLWGLPITIENPKGSIRRGTDANGKKWEQEMNNTYGKIRRTEGVDGDHIDVFIGPNLLSDKVFVVDQLNVNTGEFDEHKVMLGFDSLEDAQNGYLSNYEEGWQGMGTVTEVTMDEFKKWIDSSHRKTKPFAEYKSVKTEDETGRNATPLLKQSSSNATEMPKNAENEQKNEKSEQNILINQNNSVSLQPNEKQYTADGLSVVVNTSDFNTYLTPDAKEVFSKLAVEKNKSYAYPSLAFVQRAAWDGVDIPVDILKNLPEVKEAEQRLASHGSDPLVIDEQLTNNLADRLLDNEHGSAVLNDKGKISKKNGVEDFSGEVNRDKKAFIIIGRPAAGKSSVFANPLSRTQKARIIDSDIVKPWLEGFDDGYGAGYVQDASSKVMERALWKAVERGENIVIPKIGGASIIEQMVLPLKRAGYSVELYFNEVEPESSFMRAMARFAEEGRYLSLGYLQSIKDKPLKTFRNYADLTIQEYEYNKEHNLIDESPADSQSTLSQLLVRQRGGASSAPNNRGGQAELPGVAEHRQGELESEQGGSGLSGRLFDYAEWKNNDVEFGQQPKLIWKSDRKTPTAPQGPRQSKKTTKKNTTTKSGEFGSKNKIVTTAQAQDIAAQLKELIDETKNIGIVADPMKDAERSAKIMTLGTRLAMYYIEGGAHKFADYCQKMVEHIGDTIRPYLKSFYMAARYNPEMTAYAGQMDGQSVVDDFDVDNFDFKERNMPEVRDYKDVSGQDIHIDDVSKSKSDGKMYYDLTITEADGKRQRQTSVSVDTFNHELETNGIFPANEQPAEEEQTQEPYMDHVYNMDDWNAAGDLRPAEGQEVVEDIIDTLRGDGTPTTDNGKYFQAQEPYSHDKDGKPLYKTFEKTDGKWYYRGVMPEVQGQAEEQPERPTLDQPSADELNRFNKIKEEYPDATLIFRVGDFYEAYNKDAEEISKILGITLTHSNKLGPQTPMAGFKFYDLDKYLPMLVRAGKRVAICDQLEDPKKAKGLVKRGVTELVTPGEPYQEQAPEPTEPEQTEQQPTQVVTDTIGEVTESKHTKTGATIYVVKPLERVGNDEFKTLKRRAKDNNGYYSSFVKGFVFNSIEEATRFNNISDEQTTTEQTSADTEAVISTAEATAAEAATIEPTEPNAGSEDEQGAEIVTPESEPTEKDVEKHQEAIDKIDNAIEQVNKQLAVLGYYEADTSDPSKFHESYGYMKTAEAKALKDIDRLAKQLAADLGVKLDHPKKTIASANIAPRGGDISFRLPLSEDGKELYLTIDLAPNESWRAIYNPQGSEDDLVVDGLMWRVEDTTNKGMSRYLISNQNYSQTKDGFAMTYEALLRDIRYYAKEYLPQQPAKTEQAPATELPADAMLSDVVAQANERKQKTRKKKTGKNAIDDGQQVLDLFADVADIINDGNQQEDVNPPLAEQTEPVEDLHHGYKVGDKVIFRSKASTKRTPEIVEIVDFEKDGRPILNSFGTAYITEIADWDDIEPLNTDNNGNTEVRNDGERESSSAKAESNGQPADQNGTLGGSQQQTDEGSESGRVDSGSEQHRVHDGERSGESVLEPAGQQVEETPVAENERKNTRNFRYNPNDPAPTTNKARYEANIAAIRLLKQLQDEGRQATPAEQRVLAKFTGWGGLGEYFKGEPGTTYYSSSIDDKSPYQILKELLTDEELQAAQLSRNSAYYTPADIINELWNVARKLGFRGGNILEGSAGIGNILAQMPQSISDRSNIQAVEIDAITAGILEQLYPDAKIYAEGFQDVDIPNNSQDLVITNVPFVTGLRVFDKKEKDLSRRFHNIHDFCIAKNVRKLRQGGLGIFISSSGTLDNSKDLRKWLVNEGEADVIGAFRLNRETFGGTNATSDIIVVRKRVNNKKDSHAIDVLDVATERVVEHETDKKKKGSNEYITEMLPLTYNKYFVEHPENMGGAMAFGFEHGETYRETSKGCYPAPGINQAERLSEWTQTLNTEKTSAPTTQQQTTGEHEEYTGNLPYGAIALNSKDEICRVQHGELVPVEGLNDLKVKGHSKAEAVKDYNNLKKAIADLLEVQTQTSDDEAIKPAMKNLNRVYDDFVKKYGHLNGNVSLSFIRKNDVQWASTAAIEKVRETITQSGKKQLDVSKTDLFSKRVVGVQAEPHPENTRDGVILSVQKYGNIRPDQIAEWLGKSKEDTEREIIESRLGFRDPESGNILVSHEYLTGNVREKLEYARSHNENGEYDINIEELQKVIPMDIPAHLIEFNLGSTWIPMEIYESYLKEKFDVTGLKLAHIGSAWKMDDKTYNPTLRNELNRQEGVYSEKLSKQIYGHELMIAAMNNKPMAVQKVEKHYDGSTETITDKDATAACNDKIGQLKDHFVEWARGKMQQDNELAERIQKIYNDRFNAIVPMLSIDKEFLSPHLPGQNPKYTLYPHQQQAVVRGTMQPIMLAHEVGTGKTISLISIAMEMRRLGTAKKPMIVVQNSTTKQFVSDAKDLYPDAKILSIDEADKTAAGRREFYAKIKYNDWDLIIVPQTVLDRIPDNESRVYDFIQEKIDEKIHAIEAAKAAGIDTGDLERDLDSLENDLINGNLSGSGSKKKRDGKNDAKIRENTAASTEEMVDRDTDDVEDFDSMGIDALLVDEAHMYKHLGFSTMMTRGVKGIDPSYSKRAAQLYLKLQAVYERAGHRNVVFATGTPISNTAAEIWTFMKYLLPKEVMMENDIYYFDDFVHNFGRITEMLEFTTSGKFKTNNRFAQYGNVPELMRMWLTCADCVLTREAGAVTDKVPELEGGKAQDIYLPQSPSLIDIMAYVRKELERFEQMSGKEKKQFSYIPLNMYGIAKRAAIDTRLVENDAVDEPLSKTNKAVEETLRSLNETKKYKGTVAIFCDSYQNKISGFNLFEDIKSKLIKNGVPATQIAIIRQGMTDTAKQKIFDAVREGDIRVIMGSTYTLGTGVNIQTRLHTAIHMDAPDRPMDYTQRNGRIIRQGNMHKEWGIPIRVLRFGVEDSLDVTSYQRLKTKASFIDSIMNGKSLVDNNLDNRVMEDVEEGIFDNPVAVLSGSQYALLKSQAERDLRKWQSRLQQHNMEQIVMADKLKSNGGSIKFQQRRMETQKALADRLQELFPDGEVKEYNINGTIARTPDELREAIKAANKTIQERSDAMRHDSYADEEIINLPVAFNGVQFQVDVKLKREVSYKDGNKIISIKKNVAYGSDTLGMEMLPSETLALDKLVENIVTRYLSGKDARDQVRYAEAAIERMTKENELIASRIGKPFENTAELEAAQAKVDEYTEKMKAEMEAKEAKYAGKGSGKDVELVQQEDEDETGEEPEAQIYELPAYSTDQMTEAQQLATDAVIEALNDNTDLEVFMATDEEAKDTLISNFLVNGEPVSKLSGKEFLKVEGKAFKEQVVEYFEKIGNKAHSATFGDVVLDNRGVKDSFSHGIGRNKAAAFAAVKEVIENGYVLEIDNNHKDRGYNTAVIAAPILIGDERYICVVIIRQNEKENRFYLHEVTAQKKLLDDAFVTSSASMPASSGDVAKLLQKFVTTKFFGKKIDFSIRNGQELTKTDIEPQKRELLLTQNGTLYGWSVGDRIYLTKAGINPNTPIHEYTHLWAKAMMRNNREGWQSIVDIFKDTSMWDEVVNDKNYSGLTTDDAICSEAIARYSGSRGAARMEEAAAELLHEAGQSGSAEQIGRATQLIRRVRKALSDFWKWVGTNLFGIKTFTSAEEVADRVLYDLLSGTDLGDLSGDTRVESMISGFSPEKAKAISDWNIAHPRPQYMNGETLESYEKRLFEWEDQRDRFRKQLQAGTYSAPTAEPATVEPVKEERKQKKTETPAFVPGVRPTPEDGETPYEFATRLRAYYDLMRDARLVEEYTAEINNQADATSKYLKKNTLVRALLDAAKPIENFQDWMIARGAKITNDSNAYTDTFLATGRVTDATDHMIRSIIRPLARQIAKIIAPDEKTGKGRLDDIHISWHNMDVPGTGTSLNGKQLTPREIIGVYCQAKDCAEAIDKGLPDRGAAGFRNNLGVSHEDIIKMVESAIPRKELDELWRLINSATHFALNYDFESGRISEDTHTQFYQREFYVPQRGWRERDESGLVSEYEPVGKRGNDPYNAALVKARGRQSLASDPFAYIMSIDASSIVSSENNKIKQKFLQFCLDNENIGLKTGAFRVKKYWIMNVLDEKGNVKLDADGNPMMEVSYTAPTSEDIEHDREIKDIIRQKRKELTKVNRAYMERSARGELGPQLDTAYKAKVAQIEKTIEDMEKRMRVAWHATNTHITQRTSDEKKQHEVRVVRDGQEYVIELQDEKLANAINKKFKQHQEELFNTSSRMRNATRFMSAVLTQFNPEFAASNFARDYQVAVATLAAEHPELLKPFIKNFKAIQPAVWEYAFNDKVLDQEKFQNSELGDYLREYFRAGAATGFSYMQDLKTLRNDFDAMVNESDFRKGMKAAVGVFSMLTEVSETAVRFAGYVSARQAGIGVNDAAYLSKELTTNFDRAGEVADSGWMSWFSFFRATLNGNIKFFRAFKKMPLAYSIVAASYMAMGMLNQFLNPDDPDDEIWASDYTRQSNFVLGKIRIPTAHFMRMYFAAGVNAAKWLQNNKSFGEATYNTATFATQELLPNYLNVLGNGTEWDNRKGRPVFTWEGLLQGVMPSPISPVADVFFNRDFRGATINREPFTKAQEGTKDILTSKEHTLPIYKWLTQTIYEGVGGDMNTRYKSSDPAWRSWLFDVSASSVEHVVEGYMPAGVDMLATISEAIYDAATGTPTGPDKWPFVRKFYNAYTPERAYIQQYSLLNGRLQEFKRNLDDYQKNDKDRYRQVRNSQEYKTYLDTKRLIDNKKTNPTTEDVKELLNANKLWLGK